MITASTDLYCVLGNPVSHSQSPLVHNISFRGNHINAVYLAFEPSDIGMAVRSIRTLNIKGASITIPFKETIMAHLDEIDSQAREIGAVNTVVNQNGRLLGFNTDSKAAIDPLLSHGIKGRTICIVGAGGAARALAHGISNQGGKLVVTNRSPQKGAALAKEFKGRFLPMDQMDTIKADVVINTTSLGMYPDHLEALPFPTQNLRAGMVVMDVVYTPVNTRFLTIAQEKGCITIDGLSMFVAQAAAQFELWTGQKPDITPMRNAVLKNQIRLPKGIH
ncbi:MAG: shikimate dehydrogenase [Proteobacteria bacterium]|nr:shikimate dehydrogenase [Desulfobacula sp.]MBU3952419.1 shikimate dehydrogenase [Pseudomonadota bacterium]MBU4132131.1 shikimate dehydrogenase [Pseudomonadota bacterium]